MYTPILENDFVLFNQKPNLDEPYYKISKVLQIQEHTLNSNDTTIR